MTKICKQCGLEKDEDAFYTCVSNGITYRRGNCKDCHKSNIVRRIGRAHYPVKKTKQCVDCDELINKSSIRCFPCAMDFRRANREFSLSEDGYMKCGPIREHRVIMEEHLGRELLPGESVHHKNGVRHDNRVENLELWIVHQPSGQRPEDLLEWADEIIRRYRT